MCIILLSSVIFLFELTEFSMLSMVRSDFKSISTLLLFYQMVLERVIQYGIQVWYGSLSIVQI